MIRLETVILMQLVMGILLIILLLQINALKKQIRGVIKEVTDYLNYITAEETPSEQEEIQPYPTGKNRRQSMAKEEAQNRLIQTVLQEYFP